MAFEFEPSNPFNLAASPNTPSEPAQQAPDVQAQQNQQAMPEQKPFGWTDWAKKSAMRNGDYFEHDNKIFNQRDGKTFLVTGDGMGDVELDEGQAGKLQAEREEKRKEDAALQEERKNAQWTDQGYSPDPDGPRVKQFEGPIDRKEFMEDLVNEGKPSDEQMWNSSRSRQGGRIIGGAAGFPDLEGLRDAYGAGKNALEGKELSDAEKWQLAYNGGRVAAYYLGGKIVKGVLKR